MTRDRLIEEATDVIWAERTKGGYRAATHMEKMLAELRRLWAVEDELERLRGGRYAIGSALKDERSVPA